MTATPATTAPPVTLTRIPAPTRLGVLRSFAVLVGGDLAGWVNLTRSIVTGRPVWRAYKPGEGDITRRIVSPGRRRKGRDAVAALIREEIPS